MLIWKVTSMVADMESSPNTHQDLADAERAAASVYVDYPPLSAWYPPLAGVWSAALVAALVLLQDRPFFFLIAVVALMGLDLWFIAWYRVRRGTMPSMRNAPREIRREMQLFCVALVPVVVVITVSIVALPPVVSIVLTLVLVTTGVAVYERRYARAADAVRARVA